MRLTAFLLTCCLLAFSDAVSQHPFAPLGAHWNYYYTSHNGGYDAMRTIKVTKDTLVAGVPTKYLTAYDSTTFALPPNTFHVGSAFFGILRLRNDSVLYAASPTSPETYLYGMRMGVGDTIPILDDFVDIRAIVSRIDSVVVSGDTLQRFWYAKWCDAVVYDSGAVIQNIGQVHDYLLWNMDNCVIGGGLHGFLCYKSSGLSYNLPCNPVVAGVTPSASRPLQIWPNPARDYLHVRPPATVSGAGFDVVDLRGMKVLAGDVSGNAVTGIDIRGLPAGAYLLRWRQEGWTFVDRFVKLDE